MISKPGWTCMTPRKDGSRERRLMFDGKKIGAWRPIFPRLNNVTRAVALAIWILITMQPTTQARSAADDEKAVEALDIEYQAAVKENDVATMDRILADDFVLVTGLGKTYTKAGLDRKSTRLNSSHSQISYAVFCLKKKTKSELCY